MITYILALSGVSVVLILAVTVHLALLAQQPKKRPPDSSHKSERPPLHDAIFQ
ncbi:hypothetical protein [Tengunoibacter tsumagoiensis]|uniref:hypothetical protein n=1 Tax=Tengunoibacter tsumagoiensis TaxID=2014871 RepID=UPI0013874FA9|nr:hypothetical protein [Tengunoibacter tsumagoiensis]